MRHCRAVTKIAFIGAGSIEFTRNVVTDLCGYDDLGPDLHFALHDISPGRLAFAEALTRKIVAQTGAKATVSASADRAPVLADARYVINEVQVGGYAATLADFEIPARYGVRQTIADTLGIGGIFRAVRTAEHMLALGREQAELCPPEAWLLNYTNPMAALCELVYKGTPTKNVVGHAFQFTACVSFSRASAGSPPTSTVYSIPYFLMNARSRVGSFN